MRENSTLGLTTHTVTACRFLCGQAAFLYQPVSMVKSQPVFAQRIRALVYTLSLFRA